MVRALIASVLDVAAKPAIIVSLGKLVFKIMFAASADLAESWALLAEVYAVYAVV